MLPETECVLPTAIEDLPAEHWRDVPGLEGFYQVSDKGRIKRLAGERRNHGKFFKKVTEQLIAPAVTKSYNRFTGDTRYYVNTILWLDNQAYRFSVARLVYYCFVQPFDLRDKNLFIFYKDKDTQNLDYRNLFLGDQAIKQARMEAAGRKEKAFSTVTPGQRKVIQQKTNQVKADRGTYRISRYSLSGKLLETYDNAEVAAKALNTSAHIISKAARHYKLHTLKGYLWQRGAEPEIDITNLTNIKGIQRSPVFKHLKRLGQYDLEGKLAGTYSSIKEASEKLKLGFNHISSVVNEKKLTYGGFIWRWGTKNKINIKSLPEEKGYRYSPASQHERKVSQYNLDGIWLKSFVHIAEAERQTGIDYKSIQWVTQGKAMTAGGFLWRRGSQLKLNIRKLAKQSGYKNSGLERYHQAKRRARAGHLKGKT